MPYSLGELGAQAYVPPDKFATTAPLAVPKDAPYSAPVTAGGSVLSAPKTATPVAVASKPIAPTISYTGTRPVLVALPPAPDSAPSTAITPSQAPSPWAYDTTRYKGAPVVQAFGGATGGGMSVGGGDDPMLAASGDGFPWWLIAVAAGVLILGKKRGR